MQKIFTIYTFILLYQVFLPEDCEHDIRDQIRFNNVKAHANEQNFAEA